MKILGSIDHVVEKICKYALVVLFALMVSSAFIQVIFRTFLSNPLTWTEELCRYCMVWLALIGSGVAVKTHAHIAVDIFKNILPVSVINLIDKMNLILIISFSLILIYYGFGLCAKNMGQLTPGLKLPMGGVYGAIPVGGIIILYNAFMEFLRPYIRREEGSGCQSH